MLDVSFRIGNRRFEAELVPSLCALVLLGVFLSLFSWQLDRAQQKRDIFTQFETGAGEDMLHGIPAQTSPQGDQYSASYRYRLTSLTGRYDSDHQFLIDQMTHRGRMGYHVLTPFVPADGSPIVMINRGWIPAPPNRRQLPDIVVSDVDRGVIGRLDTLRKPGLRLNDSLPADAPWPRRLVFPDLRTLGDALQADLAAFVVLLSADQSDGYVREWKPRVSGPGTHIGYAVQWFALAAVVLIIFVWQGFKRGARPHPRKNHYPREDRT